MVSYAEAVKTPDSAESVRSGILAVNSGMGAYGQHCKSISPNLSIVAGDMHISLCYLRSSLDPSYLKLAL